jgi:hypothetical protein
MKNKYDIVYQDLLAIYDKHRRKHKSNPDSKQMCCMWSTSSPPDTLKGTLPLCDIEIAFDICINENNALEMYDMDLDKAAGKIIEMQEGEG